MSLFIVSWNLNGEKENYDQARDDFIEHLEVIDNVGDPGLESVRWLDYRGSARDVRNYLRQMLDDDDCLFVSKLNKGEHSGRLRKATWNWINARL